MHRRCCWSLSGHLGSAAQGALLAAGVPCHLRQCDSHAVALSNAHLLGWSGEWQRLQRTLNAEVSLVRTVEPPPEL
jgi:hypothetical protein